MISTFKKIKIIIVGNILITNYLIKFINKIKFVSIVGVITNQNKKKSDYSDLSIICKKLKINYIITKNINSAKTIQWTKKLNPDFIFCLGWSQILKKNFFNIPKKFTIGFHPSCLPQNKGKHPLIWSIILDNKYSCTTFFKMDKQIDNGKIISQKKFVIGSKEYVKTIYEKVIKNAKYQILLILENFQYDKKIKFQKTPEKNSNYRRKRSEIDGIIDWRMSGRSIFNHVRALSSPYPFAHFNYNGKSYKIHKLSYKKTINFKHLEPGKVLNNKKILEVICGDGFVRLEKIEPKINLKKNIYL